MSKYLSKEESTAIKGLLVFIIILGHNAVLTKSVECIQPFVYLFHVKIFFILPFFYQSKTTSFKDCVEKNFIRLYHPFLLFFVLLSLLYYFLNSTIIDPHKIANGLDSIANNTLLYYTNTIFTGNAYLIDFFTGYQFLWFLPVIFSMMIIKNHLQEKRTIRYFVLVVGFILYLFFYSISGSLSLQEARFNIMLFSPFAIFQGIAMFFLGYTCSRIILYDKFNKAITGAFSALFIALSIFLIYNLTKDPDYIKVCGYGAIIRFIMPYLFMGILYLFRKQLSKMSVFIKLGELSLPIYIFSTLICTVFYLVFGRLNAITPLNGIIALLLITVISYYVAMLLYKLPIIRKLIFPRDKKELSGFCQRQ